MISPSQVLPTIMSNLPISGKVSFRPFSLPLLTPLPSLAGCIRRILTHACRLALLPSYTQSTPQSIYEVILSSLPNRLQWYKTYWSPLTVESWRSRRWRRSWGEWGQGRFGSRQAPVHVRVSHYGALQAGGRTHRHGAGHHVPGSRSSITCFERMK